MTAASPALRLSLFPSEGLATAWQASAAASDTPASIGCLTVGPTQFAHRVATFVGAPMAVALQGERIAATDQILAGADDGQQWFSKTRVADPLGAAQSLLDTLDTLKQAGWTGAPLASSPLLACVSWLTGAGLPAGTPDAVADLLATVRRRPPTVSIGIALQAPRSAYDALTLALVDALASHGCQVEPAPTLTAAAPPDTDLGRLQRALLGGPAADLVGDDTLRVLEGDGPWEAAALATALTDDAALWLLSGEAAILDQARRQLDRPALGGGAPSRWRPALQVLPLVLALQTGPQDPAVALELLTLPISPVPSAVRRRLVDALGKQPAVGSPAWKEALTEGIAAYVDRYPDRDGATLRARVERFFPTGPPTQVTAADAAETAAAVAAWLRGQLAHRDDPVLGAAASIARALEQSLGRVPAHQLLGARTLAQLHAVALGQGVTADAEPEAGAPATCVTPEAVPRGVDRLVWFGLVAGQAEAPRARFWTPAEQAELSANGVALPAPGAHRENEQAAWLGAVLAPSRQLTIVTWRSAGGARVEAHPLLDLWQTRTTPGALQAVTTDATTLRRAGTQPFLAPVQPAREIRPTTRWPVPQDLISTTRNWSASSMEALISCPLKWTFNYAARLRVGATQALPSLSSMSGTFGHALFETLLFEPTPGWEGLSPEGAEARMLALFDDRVSTEAAPLDLPAHADQRRRLRGQLGGAARALVAALKQGGWRPKAPEQPLDELSARFDGQHLTGSIDLLIEDSAGRQGVIDLKLGGAGYRGGLLQSGTALQLAFYAYAVAGGTPPFPPVAYFILQTGQLLTTDETAFPGATILRGPSPGEVWLNANRAWDWWATAVRAGAVVGRGKHLGTPDPHVLEDAVGRPPDPHPWHKKSPPCGWCDARRLCTFQRAGGAA